ncbi:hypothetical protein P154DRAFT_569333 [Amniculicola lignicola CBS 123094]|uniref:Mid2 domain-containing protein n=1 Tax=Amniculicola lignicola CBS 123094 TaxID=1392246 RepID=A0A6A5X3H4_9PLEO|nr:hypothetical protein P154DRAFT_569333 [Amniculicola lignicola CBS 123094]
MSVGFQTLVLAQIFTVVFANAVGPPTITPRAQLPWKPRQNTLGTQTPTDFVGWRVGAGFSTNTSDLIAFSCGGADPPVTEINGRDTYLGCFVTDQEDIIGTLCDSNTVYGSETYRGCYVNFCNTHTVYTGSKPDTNAMRWVDCFGDDTPVILFQQLPEVTLTSSTSSSTTSMAASLKTSPTIASTPTSTIAPPPAAREASRAWVAGVVVGGVAIFAVAGLVFWLLWTRKRNKTQAYQQAPQTTQYPTPGYPSQDYAGLSPQPYSYTDPAIRPQTLLMSPYQDGKGFGPHSLGSEGGQDPRFSYYAHNGVPEGPIPANSPPPGELPGMASPVAAELPESNERTLGKK